MVEILQIIFTVVLVLSSVMLIISVLMQKSQSDGMGAIAGSDTFFGGGKSSSLEAKMAKLTKIAAIIFLVMALALVILQARFTA